MCGVRGYLEFFGSSSGLEFFESDWGTFGGLGSSSVQELLGGFEDLLGDLGSCVSGSEEFLGGVGEICKDKI